MSHHRKHSIPADAGLGRTTNIAKSADAIGDPEHNGQSVNEEDIRLTAYRKWESAGKPTGDGIEFWLEAELELVQETTTVA